MADGDLLDIATRACALARRDIAITEHATLSKLKVNEGHRLICDDLERDWEFLKREGTLTIPAGTDTMTFAGIVAAPISPALGTGEASIAEVSGMVDDTNAGYWEFIDWPSMERVTRSTVVNSGRSYPVYVAQFNQTLRFWPKLAVAATVRILYRVRPAILTDTQVPLIPAPQAAVVLQAYAAWQMLLIEQGDEGMRTAMLMKQMYDEALRDLENTYSAARGPMLGLIEPGAFDDLPDTSDFNAGFYR